MQTNGNKFSEHERHCLSMWKKEEKQCNDSTITITHKHQDKDFL